MKREDVMVETWTLAFAVRKTRYRVMGIISINT